jgi:Ca2+-binding RTX toxin-like protein
VLTIDWADGTPDSSVVVDFTDVHGTDFSDGSALFNDLDATSFTLDDGFLANEVVEAVDLELLDNFNDLDNWLDVYADGTATIGNVDYSGYVAAQSGDGYAEVVASTVDGVDYEVQIDLSGFASEAGHSIKGGQGSSHIIGTDQANAITAYGGDDLLVGGGGADTLYGGLGADIFSFASGDTGVTTDTADTIQDFTQGDDVIDVNNTAVSEGVSIADGSGSVDLAAFITNADAAFTTNGVYAEYDVNGSGNAWVAVDEDNNGFDAGDTLIILTGVDTAADLLTTDFV